eukprot:4384428-Alexandrium_andersonii.AAC.1
MDSGLGGPTARTPAGRARQRGDVGPLLPPARQEGQECPEEEHERQDQPPAGQAAANPRGGVRGRAK